MTTTMTFTSTMTDGQARGGRYDAAVKPRSFLNLRGRTRLSDELVDEHLALFEESVAKTEELSRELEALSRGDSGRRALAKRLGRERNRMRLHQLYFDNLGGDGLTVGSKLARKIHQDLGSVTRWQRDMKRIGGMKGVDWVVLFYDAAWDRLVSCWIDEKEAVHTTGLIPLIVMDVSEHAYQRDFGSDKGAYMNAFFADLDWSAADRRLDAGMAVGSLAASA